MSRDSQTDSSRTGPGPSRESMMHDLPVEQTRALSVLEDKHLNPGSPSDTRGAADVRPSE